MKRTAIDALCRWLDNHAGWFLLLFSLLVLAALWGGGRE